VFEYDSVMLYKEGLMYLGIYGM